jgi:hypothetical protein
MPQQTMQAASGGLAGMYTPDEDYADGGIVAFQSQGYVDPKLTAGMPTPAVSANPFADNTEGEGENLSERERLLALLDEIEDGDGNPTAFAAANKLGLGVARRIASRDLRDLTPKEAKEMYSTKYKEITDAAGPSPYTGMRADLVEQGKERAGNLEFAKGEALLQAASDVLEGNNAIRGLAKGGARFAKVYGEAQRADKAVKRSMTQMEFHINDAERKERMGNSRAAAAAVESARKDRRDMNKAELDSDIALGRLATEMGKVNKPPRAAGASGDGKLPQVDRRAGQIAEQIVDLKANDPNDPRIPGLTAKLKELKDVIGVTKDVGPNKLGAQNTQIFVGAAKDASAEAKKLLYTDPVMRSNDSVAKDKRYKELYAEAIQRKFPSTPLSDLLANMPAEELGSVAAPAAGKPAAQNALPMPASKAELKTNQLYNTNRGLAIWNGTAFVPQ